MISGHIINSFMNYIYVGRFLLAFALRDRACNAPNARTSPYIILSAQSFWALHAIVNLAC